MDLKIGDEAPNFTANTTVGEINFHEWLGSEWGVLMSHPADFTPVCTTEIGRVANLKEDFAKRNVSCINIAPGPIDTDRLRNLVDDVYELGKTLPMGRVGSTMEIGRFVKSIIENNIKYLTGVTINFDGGKSNSIF